MKAGQFVRDCTRAALKVGIVIGPSKIGGKVRVCHWRPHASTYWSSPVAVAEARLETFDDLTALPLTESKQFVTFLFEHDYLKLALELAGSIKGAARLAGVDRTNFRRLLQRHGLHHDGTETP